MVSLLSSLPLLSRAQINGAKKKKNSEKKEEKREGTPPQIFIIISSSPKIKGKKTIQRKGRGKGEKRGRTSRGASDDQGPLIGFSLFEYSWMLRASEGGLMEEGRGGRGGGHALKSSRLGSTVRGGEKKEKPLVGEKKEGVEEAERRRRSPTFINLFSSQLTASKGREGGGGAWGGGGGDKESTRLPPPAICHWNGLRRGDAEGEGKKIKRRGRRGKGEEEERRGA